MKRIFATIAIVLTGLNSPAFALQGGPFDNGLQSATLSYNSIYQATLSYANGSGYVYFSPTANFAGNGTTAGGATVLNGVAQLDTRGSINNRCVLYYKGVSYVGGSFGTDDIEARSIDCTFNANSVANQSGFTTGVQLGATSGNQVTTAINSIANTPIASIILSNTSSFTLNGNFTAKITQTSPSLRFVGTGEVSFIAPNQRDAQASLAFTGFSGLVNSIITAVGNANVGAQFDPDVFTKAQTAIAAAVAALPALTTVDQAYAAGQVQPITVRGSRRYL